MLREVHRCNLIGNGITATGQKYGTRQFGVKDSLSAFWFLAFQISEYRLFLAVLDWRQVVWELATWLSGEENVPLDRPFRGDQFNLDICL